MASRRACAASKGNLAMATGNNWPNRVADSYRDQITWTTKLRSCHPQDEHREEDFWLVPDLPGFAWNPIAQSMHQRSFRRFTNHFSILCIIPEVMSLYRISSGKGIKLGISCFTFMRQSQCSLLKRCDCGRRSGRTKNIREIIRKGRRIDVAVPNAMN